MEDIKDVVGFEGLYLVNAMGDVFSMKRETKDGRTLRPKQLKPRSNGNGYTKLTLVDADGKHHHRKIHRIVAEAFLGLQKNEIVDHIDGNRSNNFLSNLRVATNRTNALNMRSNRKYRGVSPSTGGKWRARAWINGKTRHIGLFETQEEASRAYFETVSKLEGSRYYEGILDAV